MGPPPFHPDNSLFRNYLEVPVVGEGNNRVQGSRLWSCVFLPAGGMEKPIFAIAGSAGRRTWKKPKSITVTYSKNDGKCSFHSVCSCRFFGMITLSQFDVGYSCCTYNGLTNKNQGLY